MSDEQDYDYAGLALALNIPQSWIEKHKRDLPRIEYGPQHIRFTRQHAAEIREMFTVRPATAPEAADVPTMPIALMDLHPGRAPRGRRASA